MFLNVFFNQAKLSKKNEILNAKNTISFLLLPLLEPHLNKKIYFFKIVSKFNTKFVDEFNYKMDLGYF